jgi:hypothetical protein
MPSDVELWGAVLPSWLAGLSGTVAAIQGIGARREDSARRWAEHFEELLGLTPEEVRERLAADATTAELVDEAMVTGARSVDDAKRRLLARAAVAGIKGDEDVRIDDLPLFIRTLADVDAVHMKLLRLVNEPMLQEGKAILSNSGGAPIDNLAARWPAIADTIDPLLAALQREGLIRDVSIPGSIGHSGPEWSVTPYGQRFAQFVSQDIDGA